MHWAMSRLLDSGLLDEDGQAEVESARDADRRNFRAGHGVVAVHGDLTETGRKLMDAAHRYMISVS